jgi:hypothetical protein
VWDTFVLGQINLVLLAMVLLAFVAERNGKSIAAGVLIGLAGAIKVFPVLILPYLVWKRRWGASVVAGVTLVFFSVLAPAAVRGFHRNATEVWTWIDGMVLNETGEQIGQRPESGFMACNQSLMALTQRLLRPVKAGQHLDAFFRVNVVDVAPWLAQAVFFCAAAALCLTFCVCVRRRRAAGALENGLELSMLLCLVVLLTPLAWTYFYCWMLLPWTAVTLGIAGLWQEPRARWTILAGCAFSLALFAGALSQGVDQRPQALGVTTLGAVVLFVCLASLQRRSALNDAGLAVAA